MKVILYSEDLALVFNWQQKITLCESQVIEDINKLEYYKNHLLLLDYNCCFKDITKIITAAKKLTIKILLLDSTPTFEKGKNFLNLGVQGYGNTLLSNTYLNSAIETITNNMIWIYPEFTTSLIQGFSKATDTPDEILKLLSSRELSIATLIKDGLSNSDIAEHLEISINTVKSHVKNIYEKLNVKNRLSLSLLFKKD